MRQIRLAVAGSVGPRRGTLHTEEVPVVENAAKRRRVAISHMQTPKEYTSVDMELCEPFKI